ncbi:hypothetical protein [Nostoc sp. PA-18-2419]|nr:hypothetical protein [Nostoc sp. PA-18-2419]
MDYTALVGSEFYQAQENWLFVSCLLFPGDRFWFCVRDNGDQRK